MESYTVQPGFPIRLTELDPVKSVLQNVSMILDTPKGSCPLYRDFGLDTSCLDRPLPVAQALAAAAITDAIETYEPRADVVGVSIAADPDHPGRLVPTVEVRIINV